MAFKLLKGFAAIFGAVFIFASCKKDDNTDPCRVYTAVAATGSLVKTDSTFSFTTRGGGKISIDEKFVVVIRHDDYPNFKLEFWGGGTTDIEGGQHENLNGKHIKDRLDSTTRTIVFPDGAKITMIADRFGSSFNTISIYDSGQSHTIKPLCRVLVHSSTDSLTAVQRDDAEADGEAGTFTIFPDGLKFENIYTEPAPGNRTLNQYLLGELFLSNPTNVHDYFDDPRWGHT